MYSYYHESITKTALYNAFAPHPFNIILKANLTQDSLCGQIGHPEFHFDDNTFEQSLTYRHTQCTIIHSALASSSSPTPAWKAFGRLLHQSQDYYAHTNYLRLWMDQLSSGEIPQPDQVDHRSDPILNHRDLRSGRIYILEIFNYIPIISKFVKRFLPRDAHAWMNLDHPGTGFLFDYAYHAAVKKTIDEFENQKNIILQDFGIKKFEQFTGI